GTSSPSAD
nr:Chain P, PROTEIN (PEPTIDE ANTIGEN) [synthetic construct]